MYRSVLYYMESMEIKNNGWLNRSLTPQISVALDTQIPTILCLYCPPTLVGLLKWVRQSVDTKKMSSLWTQLRLQFLTDLFESLLAFLS